MTALPCALGGKKLKMEDLSMLAKRNPDRLILEELTRFETRVAERPGKNLTARDSFFK